MADTDVLVVGCGVSGLTTGVCLAEAGLRVRIRADALADRTTSAAAGAMWGPYLVEPRDRVEGWSRRTLHELRVLAGFPQTGVRLVAGVEAARKPVPDPWWGHLVPDLRRCDPEELRHPFVDGFRFTAPLVDMPAYLRYLMGRFRTAGGQVDVSELRTLAEAAVEAPIVVNCTGIGARSLVPDDGVWPIRGQLVVVENPGIHEFFSEDTGLSPQLRHIYPHGNTVVLGGSADEGSWALNPDPKTAQRIVQQCAEIDSRLSSARVVGHRVGLRPARAQVRLEEESVGTGWRLFHNYGHGGAGLTLSWGCAHDIADSVQSATRSGFSAVVLCQAVPVNEGGWEERLAEAWASIDQRTEPEFLALIQELAAELPPDSAVGAFERAASFDSTGHPDMAVPLYRAALDNGLSGERRRRAVIQMASSLRNLGQPEESVALLRAELEAGSDHLDDAVRAVLALALTDVGREREAVSVALTALAPHLPRYQRSMANYARQLMERSNRPDGRAS